MHVVRKSEGGKDEEMRRKSKREKLNSMWEVTHKTKNGPECAWWCCQQCLVFISCLVLTPMWLATAWFGGVSHLLDQLVRRQRVSESVLLECFVFRVNKRDEQCAQNSTGRAKAFTNVILVDWLVSVYISCCTEMSVTTFCLGGCCIFSGISLRLVVVDASFGLLQCVIRLCHKNG